MDNKYPGGVKEIPNWLIMIYGRSHVESQRQIPSLTTMCLTGEVKSKSATMIML